MVPAPADRADAAPRGAPDASRARYPDHTGFIERDGVRSFWEMYGEGEPAIVFAPTWSIVHARIWKAQVPYFARRHRVITLDGRGNGRSDRPSNASAYAETEIAADLLATLDATDTARAVIVSLSLGAQRSLALAAKHPERVAGLVFLGPSVPLGEGPPGRYPPFDDVLESYEGWGKYNRHFWRKDYRSFLEFFFGRCFTEPHSTKQIEDAVGWGLDTDPETLLLTHDTDWFEADDVLRLCTAIRCPTLIIQGDEDAVTGPDRGSKLADAIPQARHVTIAGGGHIANARDPVKVNLLIRDFVRAIEGNET